MTNEYKSININGLNFFVRSHGNGRPLFALHGFSESSLTWEALDLPGYKIYAIDLLGHGQSSKPSSLLPYKLDAILHQLNLLFTKLAPNQEFTLLGYSMGGRIALRYCLSYPEARIERLILESTGPGLTLKSEREDRKRADEQLAQNILSNGSSWFADFWANIPLFDSQKKLPKEVQNTIWHRRAANLPIALAQTLRATGQGKLESVADRIALVRPKMLYISGALDIKYSTIAKQTFESHPRVTTAYVPDFGHNVHLENPNTYNQILRTYLA